MMMILARCGTLQCTLHIAHGDALDKALRDAREAGVGTQVASGCHDEHCHHRCESQSHGSVMPITLTLRYA